MPSRRSFLRTVVPLSAGLGSGCVGRPGEPTPGSRSNGSDVRESDTPTGTAAATAEFGAPASRVKSVGGTEVAVWNVVAMKAAIYRAGMGSDGVLVSEGNQFVVASVQTGSARPDATGPPDYRGFTLDVGTDSFGPTRIQDRPSGGLIRSVAGNGDIRYDHFGAGSTGTGWLACEIPSPIQASRASIRLDFGLGTRRWPLGDALVQSLSERAATFELRSFGGRRIEKGTVRLSFDIENTSGREGRCVIATYWPTTVADDDESTVLEKRLSAGERWSPSVAVPTRFAARENGRVTATVDGSVEGSTTVPLPTESSTD